MTKVEKFRKIVNDMADLYEQKNSNYGDSFGQLYKTLGPISGLVPLHNKLDRATNLICNKENSNFESLEDTFKDLACYAVMNLIEMEQQEEVKEVKENKEDNQLSKLMQEVSKDQSDETMIHFINEDNENLKNQEEEKIEDVNIDDLLCSAEDVEQDDDNDDDDDDDKFSFNWDDMCFWKKF